jgi:hypothetical protein
MMSGYTPKLLDLWRNKKWDPYSVEKGDWPQSDPNVIIRRQIF